MGLLIMTDYSTIAVLSAVYLEDSYVVDIVDELPLFKFKIEAVLTRDHPSYRAPGPGEQYCYAAGWLVFRPESASSWATRPRR